MTHWNLRIIRFSDRFKPDEVSHYGICEVFYEDGKPVLHSGPTEMMGDTLEELLEYQEMLCEAWAAPILTEDDFD